MSIYSFELILVDCNDLQVIDYDSCEKLVVHGGVKAQVLKNYKKNMKKAELLNIYQIN